MDLNDVGNAATGGVAILTFFYVIFTERLNHHTKMTAVAAGTSAAASQAATEAALATAEASRRAAEAAERSAALGEAATHVDFSAQEVTTTGSQITVVPIRSETANVHLFSIHVRLSVVSADGSIQEVANTTRVTNDAGQPVTYLHKGEGSLAFLSHPVNVGDTVWGQARVHYAFEPESPGRERLVEIPRQQVRAIAQLTPEG